MSKYKVQIDKMRWSYSRVSAYSNCPYSFYLKYIIADDDEYLNEGNFFAEVGKYVHVVLEKVLKGELTLDEASQYYMEHWSENVFYSTRESLMDRTYEACADYFAEVDFDWLAGYEILGVEKEIEVKINDYNFVGYIDLLIRNKGTGEIIIIDHKSSAYPFKKDGKTVLKKSQDSFNKYKKQMYLYCKAVYEEYGAYPKSISWNHFKEQKFATIDFNKDEYDKSLEWFVSEIKKIEQDETFVENLNFFYCSNLCEFRNSCEYNSIEQE